MASNCISLQAVSKGKLDTVVELVEEMKLNNCDFLINLVDDASGLNMLHRAISCQHLDIVKYLIDQGASKQASCCPNQNSLA